MEGGGREAPRSHAEIVAAMAAYASGTLSGRAEAVVRRHLAGGCRECFAALFARRVGLPRAAPAEPPAAAATPWLVLAVVLVVIALMGTVLASTLWRHAAKEPALARHARPAAIAALETRAAEAGRRLGSLAVRSRRLEADLRPLALPPAAGRPAAGTAAESGRPPRYHPRGAEAAARALARLGSALGMAATRLAPLRPGATAGDARGWLAWDPLRGRLFVYAVGLPRLVAPWEVRIDIAGEARRLPLARLDDGGLWALVDALDGPACVASVAVVPPRAERKVLRSDVVICPVEPAA